MFNALMSTPTVFFLSLLSFFILFTVRRLFIKRPIYIFLYHAALFFVLFIAAIGGGSVQNDNYKNLEIYTSLEKNNQLEDARINPQKYDSLSHIDLEEFANSAEFRAYLHKLDGIVDKAEAIFIGWIFVFMTEFAMLFVGLLSATCSRNKSRATAH
jgi:hypothetical protein